MWLLIMTHIPLIIAHFHHFLTTSSTEEKITNGTNERIARIIREIRPICEIRDRFLYFSECSESVTLISRENEPSQIRDSLQKPLFCYELA